MSTRQQTYLVTFVGIVSFLTAAALSLVFLVTRGHGAEPTLKIAPAKAAVQLGSEIFWDKKVCSANGQMCCADCHNPDPHFGYSDGRKIAVGQGIPQAGLGLLGIRKTRTLINCASQDGKYFDADGRARTMMDVCCQAVADPLVLGHQSVAAMAAVAALNPRYQELAKMSFKNGEVDETNVRSALVYYVSTIRSDDLPGDRLARGEKVNLPPGALRGWDLFKKNCASCHDPRTDWRDNEFHNTGESSFAQNPDKGRSLVTGNAVDDYKFLTYGLREVAKQKYHMHDGRFKSLKEVVAFKGAGGRYTVQGQLFRDPTIDPQIASIELNKQDQADVVEFLEVCLQGDHYPEAENPHAGGR